MTSRSDNAPPAGEESGPAPGPMPDDEAAMWAKAAEGLQPPAMLVRALEHQKSVISTVATVGTLLAGLGGVTAAITAGRGSQLVLLLTTVVSALAGSAVVTALAARRPTFDEINTHDLLEVRDYHLRELDRRRTPLRLSSGLLISAAVLAVLVALVAGGQTLLADGPRNLASLSTTVGAKGTVTVTLGGAVDRLGPDEHVRVQVTDGQGEGPLVDQTVHPDGTGTATLSAAAVVPAGSTSVTATVQVHGADGQPTTTYELSATHPPPPDDAAVTTQE